jgi:hypothetical protein
VRHDDLTLVAERQVPAAGQLVQARGHLLDAGTELRREFAVLRRAPGPGERAVDRQPQILTIHAAILAKPDEYPGGPASVQVARISARAARSDQAGGRPARGKGATMHPMFVQLYLEPDADQDEQDSRRRRAARSRRLRSRMTMRVAAPAPTRDRQPQR